MAVTTGRYIYSNMLKKAYDLGIVPNKTKEARDWFRQKALNFRQGRIAQNRDKLFQNSVQTNFVIPGKMYAFIYDAKHKDTLPFWDKFPLIIAVEPCKGGFYGLNLHYLPPVLRAKLMDALYMITNNKRYDTTTKIMLSYKTLKSVSNLAMFKPCFKMYLNDHVRSKFIYIMPVEWWW